MALDQIQNIHEYTYLHKKYHKRKQKCESPSLPSYFLRRPWRRLAQTAHEEEKASNWPFVARESDVLGRSKTWNCYFWEGGSARFTSPKPLWPGPGCARLEKGIVLSNVSMRTWDSSGQFKRNIKKGTVIIRRYQKYRDHAFSKSGCYICCFSFFPWLVSNGRVHKAGVLSAAARKPSCHLDFYYPTNCGR